jgi:GNAT superfamily N-acetyltransferase
VKTETAFDIGLQNSTVHRLLHEDIRTVQTLFEKCLDYMLLVDGHAAEPDAVEEEFFTVPPGNSPDDKFVHGILNQQNDLVGILDAIQRYPDTTTWWIGLLLFKPEVRSLGIGQKVMEGFTEYVRARGSQAIMLGVVEENKHAALFWTTSSQPYTDLDYHRDPNPNPHSYIYGSVHASALRYRYQRNILLPWVVPRRMRHQLRHLHANAIIRNFNE